MYLKKITLNRVLMIFVGKIIYIKYIASEYFVK